ncbi:MAG: DUF4623 domain-containing protein [Bacteroidetes bacterium]|nr:DUF4623 domain-containing protein [Bacteroidota bacterium]
MSNRFTFLRLLPALLFAWLLVGSNVVLAQEPPGSTCENPLIVDPVAAPLVGFQINSEPYGNNYSSTMVVPNTSYLNGNDVVFQFTLSSPCFINASIQGSWTGLIFVGSCPNAANPVPRLAFAGGSTGATVPQFSLDPGTYFMIASTWPAPQFTDMTINFSATPIPQDANLVTNVSSLNVGWAVPGFDTQSKTFTITNNGLAEASINPAAVSFTGTGASQFSVEWPTTTAPASITPVTTLLDATQASGNLPAIIDNAGNNRGAGFNGQYVFVASRQNGNHVYYWDINNPGAPQELNLTGVSGGTFTLSDLAVVGNHIFVSNMVFAGGEFKVYYWNGLTAQPTVLLSYPNAPARLGDAFTVVGDPAGNAFLIASGHGTKDFYVWEIVNGQIPNTTPVVYNFPTITNANFGRVVGIPGSNYFIASGSGFGVLLLDPQMNILAEIPAAWFPYWSMYPMVFYSSGQRYLAYHHVQTGAGGNQNVFYVLDLSGPDLVTAFNNLAAGVFADKVVHSVNLGNVANGNASVGLDNVPDAQGNPVFMAYSAGNGFIVQKFTNVEPVVIPFGQSRTVKVNFNPSATGLAEAVLNIPYNNAKGLLELPVQGTGYDPMSAFSQNFDEVNPIPAGWMPDGWSGLVQSTAATAVVDVRNVGSPISPPNHVRLFYATDLNANVLLISPVVTNLAQSWVRFAAKMSVSTHTGNVQVGYTTSRTNPADFVPVQTVGVTGTYANYNVSFVGGSFPDNAYIAFRFVPEVASRTLYLDDIIYEEVPTQPVLGADKDQVNFGNNVFIYETANNTLTISNTGAGTLTINQGGVSITGADAAAFNIVYPDGMTWPIALTTGQTFVFNLQFTPAEARPYAANLVIQANTAQGTHTIPLLGTGYDATVQPGFLYDFVGQWPPQDWRKFEGLFGTQPIVPSTANIWVHKKFGNNASLPANNSANINLYSTSRRHWLMSPPINLGDGRTTYQLEFDLALTEWNQTTPATLGPSHKFAVVISTDGGLTWSTDNVLQWWDQSTPISNTGDHIVISLSGYSGRVMLGFYGEATVSGGDVDLFFTNVTVVPSAVNPFAPPQNLTATTAPNSVTLNWDAPAVNTNALNPETYLPAINGNAAPVVVGSGYDAAVSVAAGASAELMQTGGAANLLPGGYKANSTRTGRTLLHDNGPFINSPGTGPGGSDESILQNSTLGMNTLGAGIQYASGNRMADDVVVPETWNVESITVYAYQTGSTTTSTMTGGYIQVWDGDPTQGGQIIWGDMTTNRMTATGWTNTYRRSETTPGTTRPIMYLVLETPGLTLEPGTYWIDYSLAGSLASGPWAPPITINGQAVTGNAKQFLGSSQTWQDFLDTGTGTPAQGLPFLIEGTAGGGGGSNLAGYNIYRDGTLIGNVAANTTTYTDAPVAAGTYTYGVTAVYGEPNPGESEPVTTTVTVSGPSGAIIAVSPESISNTLEPNQTGTQMLTISNTGGELLEFTITVTTNTRGTTAVETPREGYSLPMGSDRMNPTDAAIPAEPVIKPLETLVYRSLTQGFEDITLLPGLGWALTNNSSPLGTTSWFQGNATVFPAQAGPETSYIGANYNNTGSIGTISNWLITPVLELENGATVTFWTRTPANSTWADRLELRMSTAGSSTNVGSTATSVGDFTTVLLTVNPDLVPTGYPQVWTEYTATISGLSAPVSGRLAFRYYVTDAGANGTNSNYIGIDSFVYSGQGGGGGGGDTWLTATPLTGTVPAGGNTMVEVGFNSANLALGTYTGNLNIASNATNQPSLDVPVTLNVAGPSYALPFEEDWASGSFATNGWSFDPTQGNWRIITSAGNPAPSAEFYWSPSTQNYSHALVSRDLDATANSTVIFDFDIFLDNYNTSTLEEMKVYVWDGASWVLIDTFSNQGDDFPWTSKSYNITAHAAGKITRVKFEATGANSFNLNWWRIDNIKVYQPATVDLAALAVVGNVTPTVGTASTYTVQVKNNGGATQSNYTVKLRVNGTEVASVAGPAVEPAQIVDVPLTWTPATEGAFALTGEVIVAGDENPANNITPPLNVLVQPSGIVAITIGGQTTLPTYRIPFDFYWKNSLAQTLFYPDEMDNTAGAITGINLFNNFATNLPGKEVKIWMGTTTQPDLSDGWVDPSTLTLVFDGTVDFPIGANTIFIPFNQPYIYTGGNLVLYTYRVWEDQYFNSNDKFYVTETPNKPNRTRHVQADATVYDPTNPPAPAATQLKNGHPDITLFFNTSGLGALQGVVSNPQGAPVEGVKVQIVGTSSITYTNAQGQYNFPYVIAGQINVEFSKLGYITQTQPATITADQTTTLNVTLQPMPQVTVSGFVAGNDAPTVGLAGAAVVLEGYQNYNATTGANGQFSIAGVYANQTYTIKVTKDGYQPYQSTVQVGGTNLTLPNIILTEIILSPKNLTATISPTNPNLVQLQWNMIQEVEFRYDDGVSTGQLGFQSGTTNGVIGAKHPQSATLSELSWYLTSEGGPHASIVIRVFGLDAQGMPNSANVLYEATVTNVDNQWNTHTLPQPIVAQGGFFIGVAYNGFVGIATDDGVGEPWVFQDGTHYYNSNYTSGTWSTFESLGADFRKNCLIRAKGAPGAVNSYAITPPIINGEPMSYIPGKKVETGEPAWSNNESKALQYFKVYKNGQLLASNITQMEYSYMEMQLGQHCYHVTAVYGSGESGPSNEACVNILVGVDEQLEAATSLYPNPASEAFSIRSLPMQRVTITNAVGVVVSDAMLSGETMLKVHTESWKAGVYLIQIHTDKGTITKRLVVVR